MQTGVLFFFKLLLLLFFFDAVNTFDVTLILSTPLIYPCCIKDMVEP